MREPPNVGFGMRHCPRSKVMRSVFIEHSMRVGGNVPQDLARPTDQGCAEASPRRAMRARWACGAATPLRALDEGRSRQDRLERRRRSAAADWTQLEGA